MKSNAFSEKDKEKLRTKMCEVCEESWRKNGYMRTSITYLTSQTGISTGAFYLLYETKEDVFVDTLIRIRTRLEEQIQNILNKNPNKFGLIEAMKWIYREYDKSQFLYDFSNPDFHSFYQKLSEEKLQELKESSIEYTNLIISQLNLKAKGDVDVAYTALNTLLYTVSMPTEVQSDKFAAFDTLIKIAVDSLFEEIND
ncbi:TetR/AcrR family transcriptional regulator [Vagococcus elongatus]|uniref:HTH tetR-type domain-containing protein n=1 Tax=Vagococcus elongatus TaxID=180344 RepID=A0A430ASF2_9ENTE|nr:TetR/AcrR family transcriptional regulator [Vagococcus elongatus]RSU10988.1 hypothetical protein CBF29_08475 [Vagococcus elongatus]